MQKKWFILGFAAVAAVAIACGESTNPPASPTPPVSSGAAAADGSTLKIGAPTLTVPANGTTVDSLTPGLFLSAAAGKYVAQTVPFYRFVVVNPANTTVYDSGQIGVMGSVTAVRVPTTILKAATTYRWRARGESGSYIGPWSGYFIFTTP